MRNTKSLVAAAHGTLRASRLLVFFLLGCLLSGVGTSAQAAVSERDMQVLARTLGFLDPPLSGDLRVGIVYDPASTASTLDANAAQALLQQGLRVGNMVLHGVLVPVADAHSASVDLFLLAAGSSPGAAEFAQALLQRKLPCISLDLEQVRAGHCIVGIQSTPRVEIMVNSQLASACGMSFASVFRMMIKEF